MEFSGSHRIPALREAVWAALEDPDIVKACLDGCERLEEKGADSYEGALSTKIGPVRANFAGAVTRVDAKAPERFGLIVDGTAGDAGAAKGRADVTLAEEGGDTLLTYTANADVSGKISQLGSRLVSGVARQTIEGFFTRFMGLAEAGALTSTIVSEAPPLAHEEPAEQPATIEDAPPIAASVHIPPTDNAIAPTETPAAPDPQEVAAAQTIREPEKAGSGTVTRIMLVALVAIVVGGLFYYVAFQAAPH